jgi:hypothetical protein
VGIDDFKINKAILSAIPNCLKLSVNLFDEYISLCMCRFNGFNEEIQIHGSLK